jgi:hypothetical protein
VKCFKLIFSMVFVLLCVAPIHAASGDVEFSFAGSINAVTRNYNPFNGGWKTNPATAVTGRVTFDPTSTESFPIPDCGDCIAYRQHIPGGFTAMVGTTLMRADDYLVEVENDVVTQYLPNGDPIMGDLLAVVWTSDPYVTPPLESPLKATGVAYSSALFQLNLDGSTDAFPNSKLPTQLDLGQFTNVGNNLDDNRTDLKFGATFVWSTLTAWGGPGDFNNSGTVEASDYDAWRSNFGSTTSYAADGNVDGVVDAADYVLWRHNNTQIYSGAAVPEPSAMCLLIFAGLTLSLFRCK